MPRILAIDFGTKRIGLAVTDPLQMIANALETVPTHSALDYLEKYLKKEEVEAFVMGEPRQMNGQHSESWGQVRAFANKLLQKFPTIPLHFEDERLTSKMAKDSLLQFGVPKKKRQDKSLLDSTAAALILQSYLDRKP